MISKAFRKCNKNEAHRTVQNKKSTYKIIVGILEDSRQHKEIKEGKYLTGI